jgi:hypothetical protein
MPLTESDKITLTRYPVAPCKCPICHRGSDGALEFIDFQLSFDFDGAVTPCVDCWKTAAELIGYVSEDKIQPLLDQLKAAQTQLESVSNERDQLQSTLDSLFAVRPNLKSDNSGSDVGEAEGSEKDPGQPELDFNGGTEVESGVNESATKRGPKNISQSGHIKL